MSRAKPGIPPTPKSGEDRRRFDQAVKETLESMSGRRGGRISELDTTTATAEDCATKINEILQALQ
jgi:hypothetical protein